MTRLACHASLKATVYMHLLSKTYYASSNVITNHRSIKNNGRNSRIHSSCCLQHHLSSKLLDKVVVLLHITQSEMHAYARFLFPSQFDWTTEKKKKNSWVCCSFLFWSNLSLRDDLNDYLYDSGTRKSLWRGVFR